MKVNIFPSLFFLAFLLSVTGCSDFLDLEPEQNIDEDQALNSDANVKAVLIGAYDELGVDDLFGGQTQRDADLLGNSGEVLWVGTFSSPREIFNKNIMVNNFDVTERWVEGYETINIVNNVLSALDVVNEDDRDRVEGEARFIRALVYFELVRYFALPYEGGGANTQLGVPLVLEPARDISDGSLVSRATVEEVYTQIISDLTAAGTLLPEDNDIFAGQYAAKALLARVYLQMDRYAEARDLANEVIESGVFSLTGSYADAFNNDANSSEDIFAIEVSAQDGVNALNTFYSVPEFGGRDGDIEVLDAHLALYEPDDERADLFFTRSGSTFTGKYNNQFANISVLRLAEMYLIRAEANQRLGTSVGATPLDDYNAIRERAGLPRAGSVTLEDILEERRRELAFEGFLIHDVKRLQGTVGPLPYDDPRLVFPIPAREITVNPNLVQNPGY